MSIMNNRFMFILLAQNHMTPYLFFLGNQEAQNKSCGLWEINEQYVYFV